MMLKCNLLLPQDPTTLHNTLVWMAASRMLTPAAPATLKGLPGRSANMLRLLATATEPPARLLPLLRRPLPLLLRLQANQQAKLPSPCELRLSLLLRALEAAKRHSLPAEQMEQLQAARLHAWLVAMLESLSSPRRSRGRQNRSRDLMLQQGRHPLLLLLQLRSRVGSTGTAPGRELKSCSRGLWQERPVSVPLPASSAQQNRHEEEDRDPPPKRKKKKHKEAAQTNGLTPTVQGKWQVVP